LKDAVDQDVRVGDFIAFTASHRNRPEQGEVVSITPTGFKVKNKQGTTQYRHQNKCIKVN
jgi:hypothetical protein